MGGNSNVCTVRGYDKVEANLRGYADGLCLELSYLDIAIWVVMRVYQREFAT
jgi:thermostable 8-oxoguanine DNA glycosylase